ncbi:hypothetical protein F4808DRAFT_440170 [Astrocystis sublimbata]|nr:hypothetical protein F4808DRAFT_469364 [Astrocystis sublimbata]KAI0191612.1 hypothetical protein F4808DRAFT_443787 [Astrocystis sublimbata]KAI0195976.1 hypothetical protein F4808DRAFT_440170 [Astrocystis sublimbata]
MPRDRIVVDGLWRCLCPLIDVATLSKPFHQWTTPRPPSAPSLASRSIQWRRQHSLAAAPTNHEIDRTTEPDTEQKPEPGPGPKKRNTPEESRIAYLARLAKRSPWIPDAVLRHFNPKVDKIPTRTIYAALKELQGAEDTYHPVTRLVEYLVAQRRERPNAALYESLIKANVSKQYGSAKVAAQLLREIHSHSVPTTPQIYHALLEVTAVHPDYLLRAQVLHDMMNRWYALPPSAEINIIIGLLRDGQYELAFSRLEELNRAPVNVPTWLSDLFLYTFGELGFHEETMAILKHRQRLVDIVKRVPPSPNVWQFLLDMFSRDAFYPGVKLVWDHSVAPSHIHPPDGVLLRVLNTASMHGDVALAMGAIHVLSARGVKLSLHHYEALMHVHLRHDDLRKGLTVLCIMAKAGLSPDLSTTRPIFQLLRHSSQLTDQALALLHQLKAHYSVPPAAFNVVLEATAAHGGFKVAFDMYRTVRQVCITGPDLETFDVLLQHCTLKKSMSFLEAEMDAFSLKPTKSIYDHFIRISSMQYNYDAAFRYLGMMRDRSPSNIPESWWMSKHSAMALLRRCVQNRDPRFGNLFGECHRRQLLSKDDIKLLMSVKAQYASNLEASVSHVESFEEEPLKATALVA